jgi:hypothetical protein
VQRSREFGTVMVLVLFHVQLGSLCTCMLCRRQRQAAVGPATGAPRSPTRSAACFESACLLVRCPDSECVPTWRDCLSRKGSNAGAVLGDNNCIAAWFAMPNVASFACSDHTITATILLQQNDQLDGQIAMLLTCVMVPADPVR